MTQRQSISQGAMMNPPPLTQDVCDAAAVPGHVCAGLRPSSPSLIRSAQPDEAPFKTAVDSRILATSAAGPVLLELQQPVQDDHARALPISMETVFRLAADKNGQVAIGREKLNEALANQELTANRWLPDVSGGTSSLSARGRHSRLLRQPHQLPGSAHFSPALNSRASWICVRPPIARSRPSVSCSAAKRVNSAS